MATIYRFIVEEGKSAKSGARKGGGSNSKKKSGKGKETIFTLGSSMKGGVEANRKTRAINPLLNKMTFGYWEKATRVGRAGLGLVKFKRNEQTGAVSFAGLSGTAMAIIIALILQTIVKHQNMAIQKNEKENMMNFKKLENGQSAIHGNYKVNVNYWNGKVSYNENK